MNKQVKYKALFIQNNEAALVSNESLHNDRDSQPQTWLHYMLLYLTGRNSSASQTLTYLSHSGHLWRWVDTDYTWIRR